MGDVIKSLFRVAALCWNTFIDISIDMFTTSPKTAAGGQLYSTAKTFYDAIVGCTVPLATLFFIIAIYKEVISSPPEHQVRRFLQDALKYIIVLYLSTQLWTVMGYIIEFADGITSSVTVSVEECHINMEDSDLFAQIDAMEEDDTVEEPDILGGAIMNWFKNLMASIGSTMVFLVVGVVTILVMVAAGISIISVAFQRIIKPLVIMPFGAIVLGIGSCSGEGTRMMWHFGKNFLGFCLSGAFMVLAIKLGNTLSIYMLSSAISAESDFQNALVMAIQMNVTVLVISGLCKAMDGIVAKVIG